MKVFLLRKKLENLGTSLVNHKFGIAAFVVALFSLVLIIQLVCCLLIPSNYPTNNLEDVVPLRTTNFKLPDYELFSSIKFSPAPVNTKQTVDVNLSSLNKIKVNRKLEMYLVRNFTLQYETYKFLQRDLVNNLEVTFNDVALDYGREEIDGNEYYTIPTVDILNEGTINRLNLYYEIDRQTVGSKSKNIPLLFNDNYAKIFFVPISNVLVHEGNSSDLNYLNVNLDLPFTKLLIENSGWIDIFVPPESEWDKYSNGPPAFEFQIDQEFIPEGSVNTFKTIFSEENIADRISLVFVPNYTILPFFILFLLSPLIIFIWSKISGENKEEKLTLKKLFISPVIIFVFSNLASLITNIVGGGNILSLFLYIFEITNPLFLIYTIISPFIFNLFYELWKTRNLKILRLRERVLSNS